MIQVFLIESSGANPLISQVLFFSGAAALPKPAFLSLFQKLMSLPDIVYTTGEGDFDHEGHSYHWAISRQYRNADECTVLTIERL
jgi:hypothetical protein